MEKQIINLSVGQSAPIPFRSNAGSTGYVWMLAALPHGVWLEDIEDVAPTNPMPGKAGTRTFTILGAAAGEGVARFVLARPWDPSDVAQHADVMVRVSAKHPPIHTLYGPALQQAAASGDLARMKSLAAQGDAAVAGHADLQTALSSLKAEIAKAESR